MSKKEKKSKRHKIQPKKERRIDTQQLWFIDSNIFLEAVLDQNSKWFDFLTQFKGKNRKGITSTHAVGEVLKFLYNLEDDRKTYRIKPSLLAFHKILRAGNIEIYNVNNNTLKFIKEILDYDNRVQFKDVINIAVAYQYYSVCFCSADLRISVNTLKEFNLKSISNY